MADCAKIPVTVFTGFLGAGKTTIILSLLNNLPKSSRIVLLKNEFGDIKVDSELARESNIQVAEMVNGCLCCVLVGQMKNALLEIKEKQQPDRIIIETSGSAFPAPIAWQLRELSHQGFSLDAIVTVIDCVNFRGYEDTSYTARMQAQYTDLILLNKCELVSDRELDLVIDHINDLNTDTPKLRVSSTDGISPSVIFGLHAHSFFRALERDGVTDNGGGHGDRGGDHDHHRREIDLIHIEQRLQPDTHPNRRDGCIDTDTYTRSVIEPFLSQLDKEVVYRVKGFIRLRHDTDNVTTDSEIISSLCIVNWAFGRLTLTPSTRLSLPETEPATPSSSLSAVLSPSPRLNDVVVLVTVMGRNLNLVLQRFRDVFPHAQLTLSPAQSE